MKFSLTAAVTALATTTTASITSITVPSIVAVDQPIPIKLVNNIDLSTTYQTAIAFGLGARPIDSSSVVGAPVASIYLQGVYLLNRFYGYFYVSKGRFFNKTNHFCPVSAYRWQYASCSFY